MHDTSAPYRHEENSVAERDVRLTKEGVRTILEKCGLPPIWWPYAGEHFTFALNIDDVDKEELCPWAVRHRGVPFWGLRIPFGSLCHFRPVQPKRDLLPEFAPRGIPGIFLGYHLLPGGRWKGDYLVADLNDFKKGKHIHVQRSKEVVVDEGPVKYPLREERERETCSVHPRLAEGCIPDESLLLDGDPEEAPVQAPSSGSRPAVDIEVREEEGDF